MFGYFWKHFNFYFLIVVNKSSLYFRDYIDKLNGVLSSLNSSRTQNINNFFFFINANWSTTNNININNYCRVHFTETKIKRSQSKGEKLSLFIQLFTLGFNNRIQSLQFTWYFGTKSNYFPMKLWKNHFFLN